MTPFCPYQLYTIIFSSNYTQQFGSSFFRGPFRGLKSNQFILWDWSRQIICSWEKLKNHIEWIFLPLWKKYRYQRYQYTYSPKITPLSTSMRSKFHVWLQIWGSFIYQVFTVWYSLCVGNWFLTLNSTTGDPNSLPICAVFRFHRTRSGFRDGDIRNSWLGWSLLGWGYTPRTLNEWLQRWWFIQPCWNFHLRLCHERRFNRWHHRLHRDLPAHRLAVLQQFLRRRTMMVNDMDQQKYQAKTIECFRKGDPPSTNERCGKKMKEKNNTS